MLTNEDILDLEEEIYKLTGVANLLEAWSDNNEGYEIYYISEGLNNIVKNMQKILKIGE